MVQSNIVSDIFAKLVPSGKTRTKIKSMCKSSYVSGQYQSFLTQYTSRIFMKRIINTFSPLSDGR